MKRIRILMIVPGLSHSDGVCTFALNTYRKIDHGFFSMDFLVHKKPFAEDYLAEINHNNDKLFFWGNLTFKNLHKIEKKFKKLLEEKKYDVIHCNLPNLAFIYLRQAKKHHIPLRIMHSHATRFSDIKTHEIRNSLLYQLGKNNETLRLACSEEAGKFLFHKKSFTIVRNGIDFSRFQFFSNEREVLRTQLGFDQNDIVLGHIGRFCPQKNQEFLVSLLQDLPKKYKLLLIGDRNSSYFHKIQKEVTHSSRIITLDSQIDIEKYYSAMDMFLFPSLYEGLGLVLLEAQATDLPCIASSFVPSSAKIANLSFYPLDKNLWINEILKRKIAPVRSSIYVSNYDIKAEAKQMESIYKTVLPNNIE